MRVNGALYFLLSDHLGSTSLTTDASGNVISELRYTAWGQVRYSSGTTPTQYTYTGQYSNVSEFGLMYYNARWYDPSLGRFAQADTIVPGGAQGYDRYAYVNNDPVRYTDPTGHSVDGCVGSGCKFVVADAITRQYKNVKIERVVKWNLADLDEIYAGLSKIMGKNGFNGNMDAFITAFGEATFVPAANKSLGYQIDSNGNKVYNVATAAKGIVKVTPDADMWTIVHEMGHVISANPLITGRTSHTFAQMYSNVFDHTQPGTTLYGTTNTGEDFADSFYAVIRYGPDNMPRDTIDFDRILVITALIQSYNDLNQTAGR